MKKMYYSSPKTAVTALLYRQMLCASGEGGEAGRSVTNTLGLTFTDSAGDVQKAF